MIKGFFFKLTTYIILFSYSYGLGYQTLWARTGFEEPGEVIVKVKWLDSSPENKTGPLSRLSLSLIKKPSSDEPFKKKNIFKKRGTFKELLTQDPSFINPLYSPCGKINGLQWQVEGLGTLKIDTKGDILIQGDPLSPILQDSTLYKIKTFGLVTLQDVHVSRLALKAQSALIKGSTIINNFNLRTFPLKSFQGCIIDSNSSLQTTTLQMEGNLVNLGCLHLNEMGKVNLKGNDVLNFKDITSQARGTFKNVKAFHNQGHLGVQTFNISSQEFYNKGQLEAEDLNIFTSGDSWNQGNIIVKNALNIRSHRSVENTGEIRAPFLSLKGQDTFKNKGTLIGNQINLSTQKSLVMDGFVEAHSLIFKTLLFQGHGRLLAHDQLQLYMNGGLFTGDLLSKNKTFLEIAERFTNDGSIAAENEMTFLLAEKACFTNKKDATAPSLNLEGEGSILNQGTLYGKKKLNISLTLDNYKLVKSDEDILLSKGEITNHDTWVSPRMTLEKAVHFKNYAKQAEHEGFIIEKNLIFKDTRSFINEGHVLVGNLLQGTLQELINIGVLDIKALDIKLNNFTNPGMMLGTGHIKTATGFSSGVLGGSLSLSVSKEFTNTGKADLCTLTGKGLFNNLGHLNLSDDNNPVTLLNIGALHNGGRSSAKEGVKSKLTFKTLKTGENFKSFINHEAQEVVGDSFICEKGDTFLNEGVWESNSLSLGGIKGVNLGVLKAGTLTARARFTNALEAELHLQKVNFSNVLINEGQIKVHSLDLYSFTNHGSLTAEDINLGKGAKELLNEGKIETQTFTAQQGRVLNQGRGKFIAAKKMSLLSKFQAEEDPALGPSLVNEGFLSTPHLHSTISRLNNQARGILEISQEALFSTLSNAGEVKAPNSKIQINKDLNNTGTIIAHEFKKDSLNLQNEGDILTKILSLKGKIINKGQLSALERTELELEDNLLVNDATGRMCLTRPTLKAPTLSIHNHGKMEIVEGDALPVETTITNHPQAQLSFSKSNMEFKTFVNQGQAFFHQGTYSVAKTYLAPESLLVFKAGAEKLDYLYGDLKNEGVIESERLMNFQVASYLKKIGILKAHYILNITLLGNQNVADFYKKATIQSNKLVTFKAQRFENKLLEEFVLPHKVWLTVDRFHNEGTLKGGSLYINTKDLKNEGSNRLALIETDHDLTIKTEKFLSRKGSLITKQGNFSLTVTGGDAYLGNKVYDFQKSFYTPNGSILASGKELDIKVTQGSFYNEYGTLGANGWLRMAVRDTIRSTAGLILSNSGIQLSAHTLEIIRENCRAEPYISHYSHWRRKCGNWFNTWYEEMRDPVWVTRYYDQSDASLLQVDNSQGVGDLILAVNNMKVVGSSVLAAGWIKNQQGYIIKTPQQGDLHTTRYADFPSTYQNLSTFAGSSSLVKGRQGIDLNAENIRITGAMEALNLSLQARVLEVEADAHTSPSSSSPQTTLFFQLSNVFQQFASRGFLEDKGEDALRQDQPRYVQRVLPSSQASFPQRVYRGDVPLSSNTPVLTMDRGTVEFLINYLASHHMNLRGFQGNLYDRLHTNALAFNKAVVTSEDIEKAVEALIFYEVRQICAQDITMVDKRKEVLEATLAIPLAAQGLGTNKTGVLAAEDTLNVQAETIELNGASCQADNLYLQAQKQFKAAAKKEGSYTSTPQTLSYEERVIKRTKLIGRHKAHVMGTESYHVQGTDAYAGSGGGTYGSEQGDAVSASDYLQHRVTTTQHKHGGFFGTDSTTTNTQIHKTAFGNTYIQEGPFNYQAGPQSTAVLEGTTLFLKQDAHIKAKTLEVKPGVSSSEHVTHSTKKGFFQSKSNYEQQRTASFIPSCLQFLEGLYLNTESAIINGSHLEGCHVIDYTHELTMGMARETNTYTTSQDQSRFMGFAHQTIQGGQEVGCPATVNVGGWETPKATPGSQDTLNFKGVEGHIGNLNTHKNVEFKAETLRKWQTTSSSSAGINVPILSGGMQDPLPASVQEWRKAKHPADQGAAAFGVASEGTGSSLLLCRLLEGDPSAWLELLGRYAGPSLEISRQQSTYQYKEDVPTNLSFDTLTLNNEYLHVQGFLKAKNATIRTKNLTTAPLMTESTSHQQSQTDSASPLSFSASYNNASNLHYEKVYSPSLITADNLFLECENITLTGTTIRAGVVDAIIRGDLTIQSVLNVLQEETYGLSFSTTGDMRREDRKRIQEKIDHMAAMVGTEQFYLKVGGLLLTRSAAVGLETSSQAPKLLKTPEGATYYVRSLPTLNMDCGFYGLLAGRVLANPRAEAADKLLEAADDEEIRNLVAPEIVEGVIGGELELEGADLWRMRLAQGEDIQESMLAWARTPEVYRSFIGNFIAIPGFMLGYLRQDGSKAHRTSTMDAIAQLYGFGLEIYHVDSRTGLLSLQHRFGVEGEVAPVRLVHVASGDSSQLNHFERLEATPEIIEALQRRHEVLLERDEEKGYVFNMPGGKARNLAQNLQRIQERADAKEEVYQAALEEGLSAEEAHAASMQLDEIATIIEETEQEILKAQDKALETAVQKKAKATPVKEASKVTTSSTSPSSSDVSPASLSQKLDMLTAAERKAFYINQQRILQQGNERIKAALPLGKKLPKILADLRDWGDTPLTGKLYTFYKDLANKTAQFYDECVAEAAQEHPILVAIAQSIASYEGLEPLRLPETNVEALAAFVGFIKGGTGKRAGGRSKRGVSSHFKDPAALKKDFSKSVEDLKINENPRNSSCSAKGGATLNDKKELLPGEGRVGSYGELHRLRQKGDNLTPNHIPQAAFMKQRGINKNDGIAIMMEQPTPGTGGRHRQTRTYGKKPDVSVEAREELARDLKDLRNIYKKDKVYTPEINQSLKELIKQNKKAFPELFSKKE